MAPRSCIAAAALAAAFAALLLAAPASSGDAPDGKAIYARYCADCHGPLAGSDVRGATPAEIKYAMTDRMCGEAGGNRLTGPQIEALALTLSGKPR